jgi:hypothetical protein
VSELLFGSYSCPMCRFEVRVNRFASALFTLVMIAVTIGTSVMVLTLFNIYAVILWFAFPIGAIGYLKARFCPLVADQADNRRRGPA